MNPFRRRNREMSLDRSQGGWSTGRQLMIVVAAMVAGMLLVPVVAVAADKLVVIVGLDVASESSPRYQMGTCT